MNVSAATIPRIGFAPKSFPRDPVKVNQFAEHMFLGQILQPLTDTDQFGNIIPSVASGWTFSIDSKKIEFDIDKTIKFSNGKSIQARDVKYTLERHLKNKSQSAGFFNSIDKITIINDFKIEISLKYPDTSLIKALSRDQLGIVPEGWEYQSSINSPYIGSGPYNLVKENNKWYFIENPYFKNKHLINIKKAELTFYQDDNYTIDFNNFPEIVPLVLKRVLDDYQIANYNKSKECTIAEEMTFSQSSTWWNPKSQYFHDKQIRAYVFKIIDAEYRKFAKLKELKLATSFIPIGIFGHLNERPILAKANSIQNKNIKIKISSTSKQYNEIFQSQEFINELKNLGIEIIYKLNTAFNVKELNEQFKPDITIGSWGGGFNDPMGFLGPLEEDIGMSFEQYIGNLATYLHQAQSTQDWNLRSELFKKIASSLIEENFMLPGFRNDHLSCLSKGYTKKEITLRYTPRLLNYVRNN